MPRKSRQSSGTGNYHVMMGLPKAMMEWQCLLHFDYCSTMMGKLKTREQYDEVKAKVELLIAEATQKGMLEPDMSPMQDIAMEYAGGSDMIKRMLRTTY